MHSTILRDVLVLGIEENASDWHIKEDAPITLRIAGKLIPTDLTLDHGQMEDLIQTMLTDDKMEHYKRTGDVDLSFVEEGAGRFRANIHLQRGMHAITLRHVKSEIIPLDDLGVPSIIKEIAEKHRGIILVTGTTGSGKSTTLAGMLQHVNQTMAKHIVTIEDPIEYEFSDHNSFFEQREVGLDTESFHSALVHVLRQDPDIIMVGEMRERESFDAALSAADTGHLVLSTLHSANAAQTIGRILDFYTTAEHDALRRSLAENLCAVVSQRLVPKIGGGVVPAVEILVNNAVVRNLLEENELDKIPSAISSGSQDGMQSFNQSVLKLYNEDKITEEDALRVASNPEALKMNLKGIFLQSDDSIVG